MWMYKVKKCNFYVSSSVNNDLKTCSYVGFCSIFWLQVLLKNFLWVKTRPTGYLKGPPGSGLYIGNKIMVIQRTNPFFFMKTFIPPPKCRIWKSLLYITSLTKVYPTRYKLFVVWASLTPTITARFEIENAQKQSIFSKKFNI